MNGNYYGFKTQTLSNDHLRLEFLAEAGPRIVRLFPFDSQENLLAELPDLQMDTAYGRYHIQGGHRLWHAPEDFPRSYLPDNEGLVIETVPQGVCLIQPLEEPTGIRKSLEIHLHPDRPEVTLIHRLRNEGIWPIELAPWALTMMRLGGVAVFPQPITPTDEQGLLPNRHLALWPYTRLSDPRLGLHDACILVHAQPLLPPFKFGYFNQPGWMGYLIRDIFFCKRFEVNAALGYPDFGCNTESYCNDQFIELETLGLMLTLQPGEETSHTETWELYHSLEMFASDDPVRTVLEAVQTGI